MRHRCFAERSFLFTRCGSLPARTPSEAVSLRRRVSWPNNCRVYIAEGPRLSQRIRRSAGADRSQRARLNLRRRPRVTAAVSPFEPAFALEHRARRCLGRGFVRTGPRGRAYSAMSDPLNRLRHSTQGWLSAAPSSQRFFIQPRGYGTSVRETGFLSSTRGREERAGCGEMPCS